MIYRSRVFWEQLRIVYRTLKVYGNVMTMVYRNLCRQAIRWEVSSVAMSH